MGTSTKRPHNPIITLGIAASISMTKEAGPLNHVGASSTRNMAAPRLIGMAINKPIAELNNVPKIAGSAPNAARTASHDELPIKENPNLLIAGIAFMARTITRTKRIATITMEKNSVSLEKILSAKCGLRLNLQLFAFPIVPSFCITLNLFFPKMGNVGGIKHPTFTQMTYISNF
jgi:hypothetical protein